MQTIANWRLTALERGLVLLDVVTTRRNRREALPEHLATGERGEEAAFFFLRRKGFTVVAQRWNDGPLPGDIDLIAWDGEILCFVEVKTRTSRDVATASSAVDRNKRKTLRKLAGQYLRHLPETVQPETRFDIVTVYDLPGKALQIQLIPAAFVWSERMEREG
jgi:putative endonuclease